MTRTAAERAATPGYVTARRAKMARAEWESVYGPLPASGHPLDYGTTRAEMIQRVVKQHQAEGLFELDPAPQTIPASTTEGGAS